MLPLSTGFTDESWLEYPGYLHGNNMRVVERYWREGDTLRWQATVHDPEMLEEPWVMNPDSVRLNPNPKAVLQESLPCDERDWEQMAGDYQGTL